MNGSQLKFKWVSVREKVSNAYHDYGRLCAAHPFACLSMSILTMLVLSYPAVARLRLPIGTPIDVFWSEHLHVKDRMAPVWINDNPASYIQQFLVSTSIEPWNASLLNPEQSVRAAVASAFRLRKILVEDADVEEMCLRLTTQIESDYPFRSKGNCLVLSPASIWYNDEHKFGMDSNSIRTIFKEECKTSFCMRDLLLGAPVGLTGIKQRYQTNRKRSIQFAATIFFARYNRNVVNRIKRKIADQFDIIEIPENDEKTFVQVYFHPMKGLKDYFLLISTYLLCMVYLYFSSRKFQMVASRWGLAFAALFSVAATLLMTTGICVHLDLNTTLTGAEIYPYIALILGLENILCITRSVVYTPPSLDVSSRIAHGLSQEGYKLSKYFALELFSIFCGYLTGIPDIRDFCRFSAICIIVDFYMQLFFYAPCLTFDLQRLGLEEKRKFAEMLFYAEIPRLKNYPPVNCPMRKVWPKLFELKKIQKRKLSDSGTEEIFSASVTNSGKDKSSHRDEWKDDSQLPLMNTESSIRMRILYFITRTRIIQRTIMVVFAVWVLSVAFFFGTSRQDLTNEMDEWHKRSVLDSAHLKYGEWQKRTYQWWPAVAHDYNISLAARYVTFVPPIVLQARVTPTDEALHSRVQKNESLVAREESPNLKTQIDWLETQLKIYLVAFWFLLLTTVATFFAYVFLGDRWKLVVKKVQERKQNVDLPNPTNSSNVLRKVPIEFNGHRFPIETVCIDSTNSRRFISSCQEGIVYVWNSQTGDRVLRLNRLRAVPKEEEEVPTPPKVWAIAMKLDIAALGCSDGSVEISSLKRNKLIGVYAKNIIGVSHIVCHDQFITIARLDGQLEFVKIDYEYDEANSPHRIRDISVMKHVNAHQKPVCRMVEWKEHVVTCSFDRSIKMWNWRNGEMANVFLAHNAPVLNLIVNGSTMFSSCEEGLICWWDLVTGELVRTIDNNCNWAFQLCASSEYLLGFYDSTQLFMWSLESGALVGRITDASSDALTEDTLFSGDNSGIVSFDEEIVATASGVSVTFWDLEHRAIIGKVKLNAKINSMRKLCANSVLCCVGNTMHSVQVPLERIKKFE